MPDNNDSVQETENEQVDTSEADEQETINEEAENVETQEETETLSAKDLRQALKKARNEAAKNRIKLREFENKVAEEKQERERAEMSEIDRLKAELGDKDKALETLSNENTSLKTDAQRRRDLTGKVGNVNLAMTVLKGLSNDEIENFQDESGALDTGQLIETFPELGIQGGAGPQNKPTKPSQTPVSGVGGNRAKGSQLKAEDFAKMSKGEAAEAYAEYIKQNKK